MLYPMERRPYSFELRWNGTNVCEGSGTLTTVSDIITAHIRDNFAGPKLKRWEAEQAEQGSALMLLECNGEYKAEFADETGRASVRAWYYTKRKPI